PAVQVLDVLAGQTLEHLAAADHLTQAGEVVLDPRAWAALGARLTVAAWRSDPATSARFAVVSALAASGPPAPPAGSPPAPAALSPAAVRPWLPTVVYERLAGGQGEFLAELRPVVAVFLRFTGLDYDGDPAAGAKLDAYVRWVQGILAPYEGFLDHLTIGDKGSYLCAAFGAPLAHTDDAIRALAAATALQSPPPHLREITGIQIGISGGRVYAGAYGSPLRRTYGIQGDAVNLAARLMGTAAPGEILVAQETAQASGPAFTWETLPPRRVKGKAEPVALMRLVGARPQSVLHLQEPRYHLPLVGRATELAQVDAALAAVCAGHGQVIGLTGEPGIGKSRLVAEVARRAGLAGLDSYGGAAQAYGVATPYLAWQPIWRAFFGVDAAMSLATQIRVLTHALTRLDPRLLARLPLLGRVLGWPLPDNDLIRALDAKFRKSALETLLLDCLRAHARTTPLLLVLEDAQWLDTLSQDLLRVLGPALTDCAVLVLLAYRPPAAGPDPAHPLLGLATGIEIALPDLAPAEAAQLLAHKLATEDGAPVAVPAALVDRVTARAGGNPFYIEELVNYLVDRGLAVADGAALADVELPESVHSLLLSRIDQLTESQKIVIKVASVVGHQFRVPWLWGVHPALGPQPQVHGDLSTLDRLGLTVPTPLDPGPAYVFKHNLTREAAYESLTYATRARLHEQLAQFLEDPATSAADISLDLLAFHYGRSLNQSKQREYFQKAGDAAQALYANAAAVDYYERLLPLLAPAEESGILLQLGAVLERVGQWAAAEARYRQALANAERAVQQAESVPAARDLPHSTTHKGNPAGFHILHLEVAHAQRAVGGLLRKQGEYAEALIHLAAARVAFAAAGSGAALGANLAEMGRVYDLQGDYARARALYADGLAIQREVGDLRGIATTLANLGTLAQRQGDLDTAQALLEESLTLRRSQGDRPAIAASLGTLGRVAQARGDLATARALYRESLDIQRATGARPALAWTLNNLGWVAQRLGELAEARALYEECRVLQEEIGDRSGLAWTLSNLGNLAGAQSDLGPARAWLEQSRDLFREMADRPGMAQALQNLAIITYRQGDLAGARALLEEVLATRRALGARPAIAQALNMLGVVANAQGDYATARALYEEALVGRRDVGDRPGSANSLANLGIVAYEQQEIRQARHFLRESLVLCRELGAKDDAATCLTGMCAVALAQGDPARAARLAGALATLLTGLSTPLDPAEQALRDRVVAEVRRRLGAAEFTTLFAGGQQWALEPAIAYALEA
ncbi:MAG TPA: tetratricopeptide repeat protein, partial [Chloroflexia bacterium]|nr:tetratricopeptide repeat protein [Chloroflexia bacterium]